MRYSLLILTWFMATAVFTGSAGSQGMGRMHDRGPGKMWNSHMQNMDTSKDGTISRDEWSKYHEDLFARADVDRDGLLNEKEMQMYHKSMMGDMIRGKNRGMSWKNHAAKIDTDNDGKISRGEWTRYHQDKFDAADTGKDGSIDDKEMQAYHELMMKDMMGARK